MANYKCTNNFKSTKDKYYNYGDLIHYYEYEQLTRAEQRNFTRQSSSDSMFGAGKPGSIAMGDMLGTGIPGGLDGDMSTLL